MPSLHITSIPIYALSFILLLGAFSRFTYGAYTPAWYAFQEYHIPDDGSLFARVTPVCDTIVGLLLPSSGGRMRLLCIGGSFFTFAVGMGIQVAKGKDFGGDVGLVLLAFAALWGAYEG